jgi:hypothetical protein
MERQMTTYRACIKIRINSTLSNTWVHIEAQNITTAKALLEAQYGAGNVVSITRKSGQ